MHLFRHSFCLSYFLSSCFFSFLSLQLDQMSLFLEGGQLFGSINLTIRMVWGCPALARAHDGAGMARCLARWQSTLHRECIQANNSDGLQPKQCFLQESFFSRLCRVILTNSDATQPSNAFPKGGPQLRWAFKIT